MSGARLVKVGPAAEGERGVSEEEFAELETRAHEPVPSGVPALVHRWKRMGYRMADEATVPGGVLDALVDWYDQHDHVLKDGGQ